MSRSYTSAIRVRGLLRRRAPLAAGCALVALVAAPGAASAAMQCSDLTGEALGLAGVSIEASEAVAAGNESPIAHCRVLAVTGQRTGVDGKAYAIRFEMRLPDDWNGRFFHQLNGGNDGAVLPAFGGLLGADKSKSALALGYAVISSDAGHDGNSQPDAGLASGNRFGLDPEARAMYGYKATQTLTHIGKKLVTSYFGRAPERSYAVGCSNGGRHALVAASRIGEEYDGVLAGAPGFNLPKAAVQHALDVQALRAVNGDIRKSFSQADLHLVADAIRASCDAHDGIEDGMVQDTKACQATFDIQTLQCKPGQNTACLAPEQVNALATIHAGPKNAKGEQLYSDWSWDPGISSGDWRFWKIESPIPPWEHMPLIAVMGAGSLSHIFTTPPTVVDGSPAALEAFLLGFDFDRDAPKIFASDGVFTESAMEFMTPPDADDPRLSGFKAAGGKMIVFHGVSDGVFSFNDTRSWYEKLSANHGGSAADFVKFYAVPGMAHCTGGPATDDFDMFGALVDWVENGVEPQAVTAGLSEDNAEIPDGWAKDRTRPLCPYPQVARYESGDPEKADSFICSQ